MVRSFVAVLLTVAGMVSASAEERAAFERLDRMTRDDLRWAGPKDELALEFNWQRDQLKDDFESHLIAFVGSNVMRHYWCGAFLSERDYRRGRSPQRLLAVALWQQGLVLHKKAGGKPDDTERSFNELLAIEYARMGFNSLASHHKKNAERLWKDHGAGGPAKGEEDHQIYDRIKID